MVRYRVYPRNNMVRYRAYPRYIMVRYRVYPRNNMVRYRAYPRYIMVRYRVYPRNNMVRYRAYPRYIMARYRVYPRNIMACYRAYPPQICVWCWVRTCKRAPACCLKKCSSIRTEWRHNPSVPAPGTSSPPLSSPPSCTQGVVSGCCSGPGGRPGRGRIRLRFFRVSSRTGRPAPDCGRSLGRGSSVRRGMAGRSRAPDWRTWRPRDLEVWCTRKPCWRGNALLQLSSFVTENLKYNAEGYHFTVLFCKSGGAL